MDYELMSRRLLTSLAVAFDVNSQGAAIDIGCGDDDAYLRKFVEHGFRTLAVEPLVSNKLRGKCFWAGATLERVAISDTDGHATMYLGQFRGSPTLALSSLHADWWGSSQETREVPTMRLDTLLAKWNIDKITILKMDVEGGELAIISQLQSFPPDLLPTLVQFEYGGGCPKSKGGGGWSEKYFSRTCECLSILQGLGYKWVALVERELPAMLYGSLAGVSDPSSLFPPVAHVGNMIVCKHQVFAQGLPDV